MARDQNTVAKRLREMDKKRKAQEKRNRRQKKKDRVGLPVPTGGTPLSEETQVTETQ